MKFLLFTILTFFVFFKISIPLFLFTSLHSDLSLFKIIFQSFFLLNLSAVFDLINITIINNKNLFSTNSIIYYLTAKPHLTFVHITFRITRRIVDRSDSE